MRVFAGDYSGICLGVAGRHGVARNPAPLCHPLFYWCFGYRTGQDHRLCCVAAIPRSMAFGGIRLQTAANPSIYRGFACIRLQSGGGNRQKSVPPLCLLGIYKLTPLCSCVDGTECAVFRSINPVSNAPCAGENAEIPINTGVARSLSPSCHPVPPCHPQLHALLDIRPGLRVMTGPGERFLHG